jgi:DNA polymerase-3 subunit alpha (Gram-positive type)
MENHIYDECYFTTHFDFHAIHDNILKFDILGHDFPTLFKSMLKTTKIDPSIINYNDTKVISLFRNLDELKIKPEQILGIELGTIAIPECSTGFTLGMIKESKPSCFGDLIRISGLSHGTDV